MPEVPETDMAALARKLAPDKALDPPFPWRWRLESSAGDEVQIEGEFAEQTFPSQADAESWVGEFWADLAELGVDAVTLFEEERQVYGPMSLHQ